MKEIKFTIDGKECRARAGQTIIDAAKANGVYIPALCNYEGLNPVGSCRICTVRASGRYMAACTQPVGEGMAIENTAPDLEDMRKALIEMLFSEGNHFCPACEKSGNCELQALAYRYRIMVPRFPYQFPDRELDASLPGFILERNRCIQCQRCVRAVKAGGGQTIFGNVRRSKHIRIGMDKALASRLTGEEAKKAMDVCPVGAILKREVGFAVPIGKRKFDQKPIGSELSEISRGGAK